jgi:hypothetical protein
MENPGKQPQPRRTKYQQEQELHQLQKMLSQGYTYAEAMDS